VVYQTHLPVLTGRSRRHSGRGFHTPVV
jgi:hypothetical protein